MISGIWCFDYPDNRYPDFPCPDQVTASLNSKLWVEFEFEFWVQTRNQKLFRVRVWIKIRNLSFINCFRAFLSRVDYTIKTWKSSKIEWHIVIFELKLEKLENWITYMNISIKTQKCWAFLSFNRTFVIKKAWKELEKARK